MSKRNDINRRNFLRLSVMTAGGAAIAHAATEGTQTTEAEDGMKYRPLGNSGLMASEISFALPNPTPALP